MSRLPWLLVLIPVIVIIAARSKQNLQVRGFSTWRGSSGNAMATPDFVIEPIESMPFAEMSYVVWRPGQRHALVVDPGFEPQLILDYLRSQDLDVEAILNTHGHVD